jgi:hypothetical protein
MDARVVDDDAEPKTAEHAPALLHLRCFERGAERR